MPPLAQEAVQGQDQQAQQLPEACPFTVVIDSNEGAPYTFKTMRSDAGNILIVNTVHSPLWRLGMADYSILGHEQHVQIERKSLDDLFATLGQRRGEFEAEIYRLNQRCDHAEVVIEGNLNDVKRWTGHGPHPNSVVGTVEAWQFRYPRVHWKFCGSRSDAERRTFKVLVTYWNVMIRGKLPRQREDYREKFGC